MTIPFPRLLLVGASVLSMTGVGASLAVSTSASAATTATRQAVSVPASIDATGRSDVTDALNTWLKTVPDHSVVTFAQNGQYRVEDVVKLTDKQDVVLEGNGATLYETTTGYRERNLLTLTGGSDLVVRDFNLKGAHTDAGTDGVFVVGLEGQHGIRVLGSQRVVIEDNHIEDVYGDFVYLGAELRRKLSTFRDQASDIVVRDNVMHSNGRQGVTFIHANRVLVQHNDIDDVKRTVFDFEPGSAGDEVDNVTVDANSVGTHHLNFVSGGGDGSTNNVAITGNSVVGDTLNSVIKNRTGETRRNWTFSGNTSNRGFGSTLGAVIVTYGATVVKVVDNTQPMNRRNMKQGPMAFLSVNNNTCGATATGNQMGVYGGKQMIGTNLRCASTVVADKVLLPQL